MKSVEKVANFNRSYLLSDLLPYSLEKKHFKRIENVLKEYKLLLLAATEAFTLILKRDLASFDPLVGENACHIRAVMIALIATKPSDELENQLNQVRLIIGKMDINEEVVDIPVVQYFEKNQLHVELTSDGVVA